MSCETAVQELSQPKALAALGYLSLEGEEVPGNANPGAGAGTALQLDGL